MIRRSLLLGLLLTTGAAAQGEPERPDAEKALDALASRIRTAGTVTIRSTLEIRHAGQLISSGTGSVVGCLSAARGGLSFQWTYGPGTCRRCTLSTSTGRYGYGLGSWNTRESREKGVADFVSGFSPLVANGSTHLRRGMTLPPAPCTASDFTFGATEKIKDRETLVLNYTLRDSDAAAPVPVYECRLWLDSKSLLPLQRTSTVKREEYVVREVFSTFSIQDFGTDVDTPGKK